MFTKFSSRNSILNQYHIVSLQELYESNYSCTLILIIQFSIKSADEIVLSLFTSLKHLLILMQYTCKANLIQFGPLHNMNVYYMKFGY